MTENSDRTGIEVATPGIDERFGMIETRITQALSAEQTALVKKRIGQSIALGTALRAYPLTNADEPEIGFRPYRSEDR